jgi:hypothetical protein
MPVINRIVRLSFAVDVRVAHAIISAAAARTAAAAGPVPSGCQESLANTLHGLRAAVGIGGLRKRERAIDADQPPFRAPPVEDVRGASDGLVMRGNGWTVIASMARSVSSPRPIHRVRVDTNGTT